MLCQIINSLLLLPVSVARPLLSHLLDLLPPLDRLNRLLPAASPLEDQELQWPLHGEQAAVQHAHNVLENTSVKTLSRRFIRKITQMLKLLRRANAC